jgi:glutathione S-transferase
MLIAREDALTMAGYRYVMNQNPDKRGDHREKLLGLYREIDSFLRGYSPEGTFLFADFGLAEAVFTPVFKRFWFLEYYEDFDLPDEDAYQRVRRWQQACMEHPATDQVTREEIVKVYYDYALGAGNGALVDGRNVSSFVPDPRWQDRPWPPKNTYGGTASDMALGLI